MAELEKKDGAKVKTVARVAKFPTREAYEAAVKSGLLDKIIQQEVKVEGVEVTRIDGNILLNEGINQGIWPLVAGASGVTPYNNANATLGVGDGDTAESASQTDLQGTNKLYKGMDSGYPTYGTDQKIVFRATFNENEANWTWNEWSISNTANVNLNRKVANLGTKNGGVWVLEASLQLS
jgi:hypothetical protein